jgi:DNA-binding MarR family transcriptional regulator
MGVGESPASSPQKSAVWESWKQKLGPMPAKAIDALLMHGALTQTQLRIHVGCAAGSISDLVYRLNKAGIINKNGGKISLKEL